MPSPFNVSVVIPTFRRREVLLSALASVRTQTEAPDEIVVVDDCSGPDYAPFLASLGDEVTVLRLERNSGPSAARNAGVAIARSAFVAFLDSDDRWASTKLERQLAHLRANPACDAVHTGVLIARGDTLRGSTLGKPQQLTVAHVARRREVVTSSLIVRRDAFLRCGGFDERIDCSEDYDLTIRLVASGARVHFLPEYLTTLRRERHDHLSGDWRRVLRGQWQVTWKHRPLLVRELGVAGFLAKLIAEAHHAAYKSRSWPARALRLALTPLTSREFDDAAEAVSKAKPAASERPIP